LPEADIREVQHLVGKHLRMYHVATRRDIDDPRTLTEFGNEVHGAEGLRELYLLTVSDVSTTSPTALTNWKTKMLEELYVATNRLLSEGAESLESRAEEVKRAVLELCPDPGEREFLENYLRAVPQRYLYANDATEIVRHSRLARQAQEKRYAVTEMTRNEPYVELAVVADDRPGLLAIITACFAAARLKVVGAQIFSWKDNFGRMRALDLFWVRSGTSGAAVRGVLPRIERDLGSLLGGQVSPRELVAGRKGSTSRYSDRPAPPVGTRINVDNRASATQTVIEVTTRDQLGLLFWLANAFQEAGLTIGLAKINTEGVRVADVFYVTDKEGRKVVEPERLQALETRIYSAVAEMESQALT
jgi:[protein-PII] uridylyltransferase